MKKPNHKAEIESILKNLDRPGMDTLLDWMDKNGFYEAPCSGQYHLSEPEGLAKHSLNVYRVAMQLATLWQDSVEDVGALSESVQLCALLHDLGKCGDHGKPNYVPNILKSGELSSAKPYVTNKDLIYEEHEIRSVIIASRYIQLSEEEECAILHHNGLFGKLDSSYGQHGFDSNVLSFIIHTADMYCSRFLEV